MDGRRPVTFAAIKAWPKNRRSELQIVAFTLMEIDWSDGAAERQLQRGRGRAVVVDAIFSGGDQIRNGDELWFAGYRPAKSLYSNGEQIVVARSKAEVRMASSADRIVMFAGEDVVLVAMLTRERKHEPWTILRLSQDVDDTFAGGERLEGFRRDLRSVARETLE